MVDFYSGQVYPYGRQFDKSFEWLESAYRQRDAGLPEIKTHPLLNLRHDHRYNQLLREMRLPI
jgi:hypothetical protein